MSPIQAIHYLVDIEKVPYVGLLLTPIALWLGWPAVAIILSGFSMLVTMFCLGGLAALSIVLLHFGGVYLGVLGLMTGPIN